MNSSASNTQKLGQSRIPKPSCPSSPFTPPKSSSGQSVSGKGYLHRHQHHSQVNSGNSFPTNSCLSEIPVTPPVTNGHLKGAKPVGKPLGAADDDKIKEALVGLIYPDSLNELPQPKSKQCLDRNGHASLNVPPLLLTDEDEDYDDYQDYNETERTMSSPKKRPNSDENNNLDWEDDFLPKRSDEELKRIIEKAQSTISSRDMKSSENNSLSNHHVKKKGTSPMEDPGPDDDLEELCKQMARNRNRKPESTTTASNMAKTKTIFSMGPPMTQSKISVGPGDNGDFDNQSFFSIADYQEQQQAIQGNESRRLQQQHRPLQRIFKKPASSSSKNSPEMFDTNTDFMTPSVASNTAVDFSQDVEYDENTWPCRAVLHENTGIIMFPADLFENHSGASFKKAVSYMTCLRIENYSPYLYGFKIRCNHSALSCIIVKPKMGLVHPKDSASVEFKTRDSIKDLESLQNEIVKAQFEVKLFLPNCTDLKQLNAIYNRLEERYPHAIKTQRIERIVCWDSEDYIRTIDLLRSPKMSEVKMKALQHKKGEMDEVYSNKILPHVFYQRQINSVRMEMLQENQELRGYLGKLESVLKYVQGGFLLMAYSVAFLWLIPLLSTVVNVDEELILQHEEKNLTLLDIILGSIPSIPFI